MAGLYTLIYNKEVERQMVSSGGDIGKWIESKAREVEAEAKRNLSGRMVNVRTGRLRSSTGSRMESDSGGAVGVVFSSANYASFVHNKRPYLVAALETVSRTMR